MRISNQIILLLYVILFDVFNSTNVEGQNSNFLKGIDHPFTISGFISGAKDGWIYLAHGESLNKDMEIDSTRIVGGKFNFSGAIEGVAPFILGLPMRDKDGKEVKGAILYQGPMIMSSGNLHVEGEYGRQFIAYGTKAQSEFNLFNKKLKVVDDKLRALRTKLYSLKKSDDNNRKSLNDEYDSISKQRIEVTYDHVTQYNNSEITAYIIKIMLRTADSKTLTTFYDLLSESIQNSKNGKELLEMSVKAAPTEVGSFAPNFALNDRNGNLVTLDSFKGQFVLIDFWASWCGPCREENPKLIKIHEIYSSKGLKIIGVSLDSKKEEWLKAIAEDKLPWLQLGDQRAIASDVAKKYNINLIPMNFLIDREGRIIGRNLKGTELENKLKNIL